MSRLKLSRILLILIGGILSIIGLTADWIGFGRPGSFGSGQWLLLAAGSTVLLISLLGKQCIDLYKGVAILLLNTLVLLVFLELGSVVISRMGLFPSYKESILAGHSAVPYYTEQDWSKTYWDETTRAENYRYEPYVIWEHLPFEGETININRDGVRQTPGADCSPDAQKILAFGGSTMWGWGSPDRGTIA